MEYKQKAFTLVELLISMAIIGILAAVIVVSMSSYAKKARASRAMAQASSVIPSMISCAGNAGTPIFGAIGTNICSVIPGAANYGQWPTFPGDYAINGSPTWSSSSSWYFNVNSAKDSQSFCCDSAMNSCGQPAGGGCSATATWQ